MLTDHLHHGFTKIGTPLMPTLFSDLAFWGIGEVRKRWCQRMGPVKTLYTNYDQPLF